MVTVDAHVHLFRSDREGLAAQGGSARCGFIGTPEELVRVLDQRQIERALVLSAPAVELRRRALKAGQQAAGTAEPDEALDAALLAALARQNEWVCALSLGDDRLQPVIGADATLPAEGMLAEIRDKVSRFSVRAIKIHPALNFVFPADPGYLPIYEFVQTEGLPVISHGGASAPDLYPSDVEYCAPANFEPVLRDFPDLKLIIAHLAHPFVNELLELGERYANLHTDLSFVLGADLLPGETLAEVVRQFGVRRVLFGTDFPYFDPLRSLQALAATGLSEAELERISGENARELFGV